MRDKSLGEPLFAAPKRNSAAVMMKWPRMIVRRQMI